MALREFMLGAEEAVGAALVWAEQLRRVSAHAVVLVSLLLGHTTDCLSFVWSIEDVHSQRSFMNSSLRYDALGRATIAFGEDELYYAVRTASIWDVQVVDPMVCLVEVTDAALRYDSLGFPAIGYHHWETESLNLARWNGAEWSIEVVDDRGSVGDYAALAFDANDQPALSYYDLDNQTLKFARWDGAFWRIETVDANGIVGRYTSVVFDLSGNPVISYYDATLSVLKAARWTGSAWQIDNIGPARQHLTSIARDSQGEIAIAYYNRALEVARWDGNAWAVEVVDADGDVGRYASVIFDAREHLLVSYQRDTPGGLMLARWDGLSWRIETVESATGVGVQTSIALDPNGRPAITDFETENRTLRLSEFDGTAWTREVIDQDDSVGAWATMAFDDAGRPAIGYGGDRDDSLYVARWDGTAWQREVVVSGSDRPNDSALAFDASGRPAVAYRIWTNSMHLARFDGSTWNTELIDDAGDPSHPSLAFDSLGFPAISYYRRTARHLWFARWNGSTWDKELVDGNGPLAIGFDSSLKFDNTGAPVIAYGDANPPGVALRIARWNGTAWVIDLVDPEGGHGPSLDFDSSGNAAVSYNNLLTNELKFARFDGTNWNIEIVDFRGDPGYESSLVFDTNDKPAISYFEHEDDDLKFAWWDGAAWNLENVDTKGRVGRDTTVLFESNGDPLIAYATACPSGVRLRVARGAPAPLLHRGTVVAFAPGWRSGALPLLSGNDDETPPFPFELAPSATGTDTLSSGGPLTLYRLLGVGDAPRPEILYAIGRGAAVELSTE